MPRSNRPRRSGASRRGSSGARGAGARGAGSRGAGAARRLGPGRADSFEEALGLDRGYRHEQEADGGWHVREIPSWRAVKDYTCPGCGRTVPVGMAHVVTWRSDWIMGDEDAGADRRHWHSPCWRSRSRRA